MGKHTLLEEQKKIKKKKLEELESRKLPTDILESLEDGVDEDEKETQKITEKKVQNKKITFDDFEEFEDDDDVEEGEDFISLETEQTDFKVVTNKDLVSMKFQSSPAVNFREKMLFGSRVKREPFKNQQLRKKKMAEGGRNIRAVSS